MGLFLCLLPELGGLCQPMVQTQDTRHTHTQTHRHTQSHTGLSHPPRLYPDCRDRDPDPQNPSPDPDSGQKSEVMALISMDDLDAMDDITEDDVTAQQPMEDRLLSHWQQVGSTHQVSVPPEMTGPIHEMTRNNQERETLAFTPVSSHEKMGELQYCERVYPAGRWACVTRAEDLYEQSISCSFMKLMRYICKENELAQYLGMTVPVVSVVQMSSDGSQFLKQVVTGFFLPSRFQRQPPAPSDPEVQIQEWGPLTVIARPFFGTTNEATVTRQISVLWDLLSETEGVASEGVASDRYMVAVYENPGVPQRRNEIWFLRQPR